MKTESLKEIRESKEQRELEFLEKVNIWKEKLKFSAISLAFFIICLLINILSPIFPIAVDIMFGSLALVFIQQTIRSFNYLKMHSRTYNFIKYAQNEVMKGL